jgi:hypothetical protein
VNLAVGDANRINHELARDGALEGIGTLHAGALALGGRAIIVSRGAARAAYTAATAAATASAADAEEETALHIAAAARGEDAHWNEPTRFAARLPPM